MASTTTPPPPPSRGNAPTPLPPPAKYDSALGRLRHLIFGRALPTSRASETQLPIYMALPILSSNMLSSNAYATEAILGVLILKGTGAFPLSVPVSLAISILLVIVTLSYIQVIHAYPEGGGAYPVSRDNLSKVASLVAGASLMVDYVLTVAVSVAAGVAAVIGMFASSRWGPILQDEVVPLCLVSVLLLTLANLRGLREAGALFAIPTYVFIVSILATIVAGAIALHLHAPHVQAAAHQGALNAAEGARLGLQGIGWVLVLQSFSEGCAALTGMEAIASTVPVFQQPQTKNAATTMYVMSGLAVVMFFGLTSVANALGATWMDATQPGYESVVGQVASLAWPGGLHWMFFVVQVSTAVVLLLAANTAFAGFPQLAGMMARDGFLPRQLANIGDRLAYSNGIVILALVAAALIVIFHGLVDALLPMYAIGVFIGFTLAQAGMVVRWNRTREKGWQTSRVFNALGALATGLVVIITGIARFDNGDRIGFAIGRFHPHYGVWIVLALVPVMVMAFLKINGHYEDMKQELAPERAAEVPPVHNTVLVLVSRLHRGIVSALNYAHLVSDDVRAVYVETNPENTAALKKEWNERGEGIPLVIMESPYRSLIGPLMRYVDAVQKERTDDVVTVIVPEFVSRKWWHLLLHNQAAPLLRLALSSRRDVYVVRARYFLER